MAVRDRLYLDANIFITAFEVDDDVAASVRRLLLSQDPHRPVIVTSDLTLAEVLVSPYRDKNERLIETYMGWLGSSNPAIDLVSVNRNALIGAALLRADYTALKLPDAIHIAVAIGVECTALMTADKKLAGEYQTTHRRYGMSATSGAVRIVRPHVPFLDALSAGANP